MTTATETTTQNLEEQREAFVRLTNEAADLYDRYRRGLVHIQAFNMVAQEANEAAREYRQAAVRAGETPCKPVQNNINRMPRF